MEESGDRGRGASCVERYEQLRARVVSGEPDGWQIGLAMLERRGLGAWAQAWQTITPVRLSPPARPAVDVPGEASEIVGVLATMALACAAAG